MGAIGATDDSSVLCCSIAVERIVPTGRDEEDTDNDDGDVVA